MPTFPARRFGRALLLSTVAPTLLAATLALPRTVFAQETQPPATAPATTPPGSPQPPQTTPTTPATPPPAQNPPPSDEGGQKHHLSFGPEVGVYFPTASKARNAFGSAWFNFGVGLGDVQQAKAGGHIQADFSVVTQTRTAKQIYLAPLGVAYQYGLGHDKEAGTYVGISGDFILTQLRDDEAHIVSRIRGTGGGSVYIGHSFSTSGYVQVRYFEMGQIRGFDFSGLNIGGGFRF